MGSACRAKGRSVLRLYEAAVSGENVSCVGEVRCGPPVAPIDVRF